MIGARTLAVAQGARGVQTIHARHGGVENNQVATERMNFFGSIKSIDSLSAKCSTANHFTVVDDENVFRHGVTFDLPRQVPAKKLEEHHAYA